MQHGPSHVFVFIVANRVILFLDGIYERFPTRFGLKHSRLLCGNFLSISFPPMFEMGERLNKRIGDIFPIGICFYREITF
jgi:hypothetical protein